MRLAAAGIALCLALLARAGDAADPQPRDIAIAGSRVFPESLSADTLGTLYIGSNAGTIYRAMSGDAQAVPWIVPSAKNGLQSVCGVLVDEQRHELWVCSDPRPQTPGKAELKTFDLDTGELRATYPFPGDGPALCNDIAIETGGRVFATDTVGGRIVSLPPAGTTLEAWASSPDMRGIDGIAIAGDGAMYVNNVQKNWLARAERTNAAFTKLTMISTSLPLSGPDGLRPISGNRLLQAEGPGGRVSVLTILGDKAEMLPVATGIDYPASMVLVGPTVYVPEGKINYLLDPAKRGQDPGTFRVRAIAMPGFQ